MQQCTQCFHLEQIREALKHEDKNVLEINIKYPCFTDISPTAQKSINSFYKALAERFRAHAASRRFEEAKRSICGKRAEVSKPFGESLCTTVLQSSRGISVICDITHFDGVFARYFRFSNVWEEKSGVMLPCKAFMPKKFSAYTIKKKLVEKLMIQLTGEPVHDYYANCQKDIFRHFSAQSFFVTERGIVFYYQSGVLCPANEGAVCFSIGWEEL